MPGVVPGEVVNGDLMLDVISFTYIVLTCNNIQTGYSQKKVKGLQL